MLTHLPPRQVEFAVGCLMLVVILLNCRQKITNAPQQPQTLTYVAPLASGPASLRSIMLCTTMCAFHSATMAPCVVLA